MRIHGTPKQLETRRRQAISLLSSGRSFREVAQRVKASLSSVVRWKQAYRKKGVRAIQSHAKWGRPCHLNSAQKEALRQKLLKGALVAGYSTDLWTLKRIGRLISKYWRIHYTHGGVWKLLHHDLGWSCQKPERRAMPRDEKAIAYWKKYTWPGIKKNTKTWGPSCIP